MRKRITYYATFCLINLMILGYGIKVHPLQTLLVPISDGKIILMIYILHIFIVFLYVFNIIENLNRMFMMHSFIFPRNSRKVVALIYLKKILLGIFEIIILKLIVDLLVGKLSGLLALDIFIKLNLSNVLTIIIWTLFIIILYCVIQDQKTVLFTSFIMLMLVQYLALKNWLWTVFATAGIGFYTNFYQIILFKSILVILLYYGVLFSFKNIELYGGERND